MASSSTIPDKFKPGDVVEVCECFKSDNSSEAALLSIGQRGTVKAIDVDGDVQVHFHDHPRAVQWVFKSNFGKLNSLSTPPLVSKQSHASQAAVKTAPKKMSLRQAAGKLVEAKRAKLQSHTQSETKKEQEGNKAKMEEEVKQPVVAEAPRTVAEDTKKATVAEAAPKGEKSAKKYSTLEMFKAFSECTGDARIRVKPDGKTSVSHPKSCERYATYAKAETMEQLMELGAAPQDITYDYQWGFIEIITKGTDAGTQGRAYKFTQSCKKRYEEQRSSADAMQA